MTGGNKYTLRRDDLLYPELSFKINGILFKISRELGGGHKEQFYERAVKVGLENAGIKFKEQHYVPIRFEDKIIGKYFLDFLIEDTIVLELKRDQFIPAAIINQTKQYLTALNLQLALIACFTHKGVFIKRIVNQFI
jgi:GxxExxY protein